MNVNMESMDSDQPEPFINVHLRQFTVYDSFPVMRREDHGHRAAFHGGGLFDDRDAVCGFDHAVEQLAGKFRVSDLAAAEADGELNLVAVLQELQGVLQ